MLFYQLRKWSKGISKMFINNTTEKNLHACIVTAYFPYIRQDQGGAYNQQLEGYTLLDMQVFPKDKLWTDIGNTISE